MSESHSEAVGPSAEGLVLRVGTSAWGLPCPSTLQMCGDRTGIGFRCHMGGD